MKKNWIQKRQVISHIAITFPLLCIVNILCFFYSFTFSHLLFIWLKFGDVSCLPEWKLQKQTEWRQAATTTALQKSINFYVCLKVFIFFSFIHFFCGILLSFIDLMCHQFAFFLIFPVFFHRLKFKCTPYTHVQNYIFQHFIFVVFVVVDSLGFSFFSHFSSHRLYLTQFRPFNLSNSIYFYIFVGSVSLFPSPFDCYYHYT